MSHKDEKIEKILREMPASRLTRHYAGFFACFDQQLYFEAHEVLEAIWLPARGGELDRFYKGLIQLAGAFVHLQKERLGPATALFRLARENLEAYPRSFEGLDIPAVLALIDRWAGETGSDPTAPNPLRRLPAPKLQDLVNEGDCLAQAGVPYFGKRI